MDWTPQQALQEAIDFFDGKKDTDRVMPDGVLILFHYDDSPIGTRDGKTKRIYLASGISASGIMTLCNYVNLRTIVDVDRLNNQDE